MGVVHIPIFNTENIFDIDDFMNRLQEAESQVKADYLGYAMNKHKRRPTERESIGPLKGKKAIMNNRPDRKNSVVSEGLASSQELNVPEVTFSPLKKSKGRMNLLDLESENSDESSYSSRSSSSGSSIW